MSASWLTRCVLAVVRGYQRHLSPLKPACCRFTPTCSEYAAQAIARFGAFRGGWLSIKRICRCHPWSPGGADPIPEKLAKKTASTPSEGNG